MEHTCLRCNTEVVPIPWELKASYQSSARPIEENTHQIRQVMAQCYVMGVTTAYLSRLELCGNWKSIFGKKDTKSLPENEKPTLHAYRLEFTQQEIERNWEWLKERRDLFQALLNGGALLPKAIAVPSGQTFECDQCPYKGLECK